MRLNNNDRRFDQEEIRHRVNALAHVMDASIRIPVSNWRIGIDGIIGLIPGIGDFIGALISGYIIMQAARAGVPAPVMLRMMANVGIELLLGVIPFAGDLFDFAYKTNLRNVTLLNKSIDNRRLAARQSWLFLFSVAAFFIVCVTALVFISVKLLAWIFALLGF